MQIVIPKFGSFSRTMQDWVEREMRTGSRLWQGVEREKKDYARRQAAVQARHAGREHNRRSEFRLEGAVDARTWFRWHQETGGAILNDPKEWEKFLRDNPEWRVK